MKRVLILVVLMTASLQAGTAKAQKAQHPHKKSHHDLIGKGVGKATKTVYKGARVVI